jgi:MoaA/NifB/PqqE/SkfB family radical SAM enzyme
MEDTTPGKPLRVYDADGNWKDFGTDEFVGQQLNYLDGWSCSMGVENLFINSDGDVFGASCMMGGTYGNVFDNFKLAKEWPRCKKLICSCGADLFIPKVSLAEHLPLLRKKQELPTDMSKKVEKLSSIVAMERVYGTSLKQVHWEIGRRCNYDCSYCWPNIHNNYETHKSLEELITATDKIQEYFVKEGKCNFIITGGEPTANSAFLDWCRYLNALDYNLSMHSNGSRTPDYYQELIKYGDLNLSVHYEAWDQMKFLKVVEAIVKTKVEHNERTGHLEVKIMMKPGTTEYTIDFEQKLKAIPKFTDYCTWAIVPIKDNNYIVTQGSEMDGKLLDGYKEIDFTLFGDRNGK